MNFGRRQTRLSSGWTQAAIFNAMLLLLPVLAANVVSGVFTARDFPHSPRPAALESTREEINKEFVSLAAGADDRRDHWASLVDLQLRERNMPAARGFLLAAPQMLDERDREAVEQAAPQAVPFGTRNEQLVGAALLFLPNDVRVRFETANRPPQIDTPSPNAEVAAQTERSNETGEPVRRVAAPETGFSVLGNFEDLVRSGRDWLAGETNQSFSLRVTGLGLLSDQLDTPTNVDLRETMSLLKAADRAARLQPEFRELLEDHIERALPDAALRVAMAEALSPGSTTPEQATALEAAFLEVLDESQINTLYAKVAQVNEIVDAVGPVATLALLDHVSSETDLRRARLVAESGGERAVALEAVVGRDVLYVARTGVELTREDVLEIMGLAAAAMSLFWMVLLSFQRYMGRPRVALNAYYE
jgi:hypothetical protein